MDRAKNLLNGSHVMMTDFIKNNDNTSLIKYLIFFMYGVILIWVIIYITHKLRLPTTKCASINGLYPVINGKISSISDENARYKLRDYYIKTAYNACSIGLFKNSFVELCALDACIGQGYRCLDFEIYSIDNKPVVSTSTIADDFYIKETFNYVALGDVLETIRDKALGSTGTCPNPTDPLLLHFRIKSKRKEMYDKMAHDLEEKLGTYLLDLKYNNEYHGKNIGNIPLIEFKNKVIIIVNKGINDYYENTPLDNYINITSSSMFMRNLRNYDILYTHDYPELINYNKQNMTITMPDLSSSDKNVPSSLHRKYGCQLVSMCMQNYDTNLENNDLFFSRAGLAYVLKPDNLRYIPVIKQAPPKAPESEAFKLQKTPNAIGDIII